MQHISLLILHGRSAVVLSPLSFIDSPMSSQMQKCLHFTLESQIVCILFRYLLECDLFTSLAIRGCIHSTKTTLPQGFFPVDSVHASDGMFTRFRFVSFNSVTATQTTDPAKEIEFASFTIATVWLQQWRGNYWKNRKRKLRFPLCIFLE